MGVSIPVATMVGWMEAATERITPIVERFRQKIIQGSVAYSDDTPLPVFKALQRLAPKVTAGMLEPRAAGIRAQALKSDGSLWTISHLWKAGIPCMN